MFTDKRLILVDKQGLTSLKVDYLVVPYRAITSYSIETAGTLDMDSELKIGPPAGQSPFRRRLSVAQTFAGSRLPSPRLDERDGSGASVQSHPSLGRDRAPRKVVLPVFDFSQSLDARQDLGISRPKELP